MDLEMKTSARLGMVVLGVLPLAAGCASQQTLTEYQDEITALREERTRLKKEKGELERQLDDYAVALADANARISEQESLPSAPSYPDLDALGVDYGRRDGLIYLSIPAEITFASGKADLTSSGRSALKTVANHLTSDHGGLEYWIEGHTDADPIRKSKWDSNRALSVARAMAVLHYLVEECGIPDESCVVAGHGEYEPIASNESKATKAENRRVEIVVHKPRT